MSSSILKRTCSALLITTMLTSSLITQGFAMEGRWLEHWRGIKLLANQLITADMNKGDRSSIIAALARVDTADRETFIIQAQRLIKSDMDGDASSQVIIALASVNAADRETFVTQAQQLTQQMNADDRSSIIAALARVNATDRKTFITQVNRLITIKMHADDRSEVIAALARINAIDREAFITQAQQLTTIKMTENQRLQVISALARVNATDREAFITQAQRLTTIKMTEKQRLQVIAALASVNVNELEAFITQAQRLITKKMKTDDRSEVIATLASVNANEREAFITQAQRLITDQMNGEERSQVIIALARVNAADRQTFITQAQRLITDQMNGEERSQVIVALSLIKAADRATCITQVQQLITADMNGYGLSQVIAVLSRIKVADRANALARALLFIRGENHAVLRQILETSLGQAIRLGGMAAVAQGANPYAAGINVHDGLRDQRTIEAVKRLTEDWSPRQDEIHSEFNEFWQAVRALPTRLDQLPTDIQESYQQAKAKLNVAADSNNQAEKKALQAKIDVVEARLKLQIGLLRTLGVTLDGTISSRSPGDYGGLLTGTNGQITLMHGNTELRINARELIARFWHFANHYVPEGDVNYSSSAAASTSTRASHNAIETERANIRAAIMNGLAEGLQKDSETSNHVVCDPGKIQRLVMGTINGRLKLANGLFVDIDNIGLVNGDKKAPEIETPQDDPARGPQAALMIRNLDEIAQYLQPFMDNLTRQNTADRPQNGNEFFMRLFEYRKALADGDVPAFGGQRINLDPSEVVYFVRMMEPISERGKIVRYDINPERSLVALLGFDDFQVDDYMRQFGERDRAQLADARELEARRALVAQQDREYAEGLQQDLMHQQQNLAATNIQRIARGSLARKNVKAIQEQVRAKAELDKRVIDLRQAIADKSAGTIEADADMLNALTDKERSIYARLRNAHRLTHKGAS